MDFVKSCCKHRYTEDLEPYKSEKLYGLAYYFFRENVKLDADNLSKPIWDSLNGLVYEDDRQIVSRTIHAIDLNEDEISELEFNGIDGDLITNIVEAASEEKHFLYVKCGVLNKRIWNFNLEEL